MAGDFTQNEVIKYFNYHIPFELKNAKYIHDNGLFIGNNHILIEKEISNLFNLLSNVCFLAIIYP